MEQVRNKANNTPDINLHTWLMVVPFININPDYAAGKD
jgi:hypothetical protein